MFAISAMYMCALKYARCDTKVTSRIRTRRDTPATSRHRVEYHHEKLRYRTACKLYRQRAWPENQGCARVPPKSCMCLIYLRASLLSAEHSSENRSPPHIIRTNLPRWYSEAVN